MQPIKIAASDVHQSPIKRPHVREPPAFQYIYIYRQHLSYDDCLGNNGEEKHCSVLYCVAQLCYRCTLIEAVLTGVIGLVFCVFVFTRARLFVLGLVLLCLV